jgi:putative ABC transport system ATP-binding protein
MPSAPSPQILNLDAVTFGWGRGETVLDIPQFSMTKGERVFLRGASGSGKSTLLSLVSGILTPRSGSITVLGQSVTKMNSARRDALRARELGVIFQMFNLVPYLSVLENVALPCRFSPERAKRAVETSGSIEAEASRLLERLGLGQTNVKARKATDLSVGQQQRAAAARALMGAPGLILADEPTSALDTDARAAFITLLSEECTARGSALLFVSHDLSLGPHFDRIVDLTDINAARQPIEA